MLPLTKVEKFGVSLVLILGLLSTLFMLGLFFANTKFVMLP